MKLYYLLLLIITSNIAPMEMPEKELKQTPEQLAFERLPYDQKINIRYILENAQGQNSDDKLANASYKIHKKIDLLKAYNPYWHDFFLQSKDLHGYFITELANRYANGNIIKAALSLRTDAGGRWLYKQNLPFEEFIPFILDALKKNNVNLVSYMLNNTPWTNNINAPIGYLNSTALIIAAVDGNTAIVQQLLTIPGIDVNKQNEDGDTALILAVYNNRINVVKLLLAIPEINVNKRNNDGATALMFAVQEAHFDILKQLLAMPNINVNRQIPDGENALTIAAAKGHIAIVKELLAAPNIDVNRQKQSGFTALMFAAQNGHVEIVKQLLAIPGIDINKRTNYGNTPLIIAVKRGHIPIVKLLLNAGANFMIKNHAGENAIGIAFATSNPELINLFNEAVKKQHIEYVSKQKEQLRN